MTEFKVQVPASSANIGPGFDSMGLAVNLYLTLEITEQEKWEFMSPAIEADTPAEENFIYNVAKKIADKHGVTLAPSLVRETTSIPLARGLGSSAAAIIAGIEIANQLGSLGLSKEEKLAYATEIEGHPDNVAPALFGGLVVSTYMDDEIDWIKLENLDMELIAYIPEVELKTAASRDVLPGEYSRTEAALASSISNLVVAALMQGDYTLAGKMMEQDRFHEPFRRGLIPNYDVIKRTAKQLGAYGTVISGAGPTMVSFVPSERRTEFMKHFDAILPEYRIEALTMDAEGLVVEQL